MHVIYAYIGEVWGVNVGIYDSPMECLGFVFPIIHIAARINGRIAW